MSKESLEHLSSLMDGELSTEAGQFLARRMGSDETLNATWRRYHLIRDCLRRPGEAVALTRLTIDVDRLVDEEGTETTRSVADSDARSDFPRWLRPVAGVAIAASVAAVAISVILGVPLETDGPVAEPFASPNTAGIAPLSRPASFGTANQGALDQYLRRHNRVTGAMGQQGTVTLVPIVPVNPVQIVDPAEDPAENDNETADAVTGDDS